MEGAYCNMLLQLPQEKTHDHDHHNSLNSFRSHEYFTYIHDEEDHIYNAFGGCDDDCKNDECSMERNMYWESQEALLQEILEQYESSASKLREEITRLIELAKETNYCDCTGPKLAGCAKCLRGRVVNQLCSKGFDATQCTSTWKRTQTRQGGKHEYIEVVARTQVRKRKITLLIEIEFRDEFKMAKACDEYNKLIDHLPETYIGKPEHLNAVVRLMCDAAKRSTAEKKIHLGPWRKRSFMEMKWSASYEKRLNHQSPTQLDQLISSGQKHVDKVLSFPPTTTAVRVA